MRVIALGGAGDMCGFAVRDLACCDEVTEIMIADLDAVLCYDAQLAQALSRFGLKVEAP